MKMHETHNQLMATPNLSGWNHVDEESGTYIFILKNTGLGPAIVNRICLTVDGQTIEGESADLITAAADKLFPDNEKAVGAEMFTVGEFISANQKFEILTITVAGLTAEEIGKLVRSKAKLAIKYSSIFGKQYLFDSDAEPPLIPDQDETNKIRK